MAGVVHAEPPPNSAALGYLSKAASYTHQTLPTTPIVWTNVVNPDEENTILFTGAMYHGGRDHLTTQSQA